MHIYNVLHINKTHPNSIRCVSPWNKNIRSITHAIIFLHLTRKTYQRLIPDSRVISYARNSLLLMQNVSIGHFFPYITPLTNLDDHHARHSLLKACFRDNLSSFMSGIPPRLCKSVFFFAQPMLINVTVSYVGETSPDASYGRALIGAWALVFLGIAVKIEVMMSNWTK